MKPSNTLFLFVLLITLTNCGESKKVIESPNEILLSGTYVLKTVEGEIISDTNVFITFIDSEKTVRGNTGCNSFFGNYTSDPYSLSFSELGQTEIACEQSIMNTEWSFMQALRETASYSLKEHLLSLFSKKDKRVLLTAKKKIE